MKCMCFKSEKKAWMNLLLLLTKLHGMQYSEELGKLDAVSKKAYF